MKYSKPRVNTLERSLKVGFDQNINQLLDRVTCSSRRLDNHFFLLTFNLHCPQNLRAWNVESVTRCSYPKYQKAKKVNLSNEKMNVKSLFNWHLLRHRRRGILNCSLIAGLPRARSARGTEPHTHGIWSTSFRLVVT